MDPLTVAAFVAFVHTNYPREPKIPDRFDQCVGTTHPVQGLKGAYGSIVTCPSEVRTAQGKSCFTECHPVTHVCVTHCY